MLNVEYYCTDLKQKLNLQLALYRILILSMIKFMLPKFFRKCVKYNEKSGTTRAVNLRITEPNKRPLRCKENVYEIPIRETLRTKYVYIIFSPRNPVPRREILD